ncbi:hypothetical protein [Actinoplanes derwentensis]|uniref:Uncharacterized protein n=1 Tax=Actinoplanes derwentensis TaxID=113562 RepID=A0A1H1ZMJ5_9ACTN|nr:hypothetical protein [Actinoplanes derwentensis]GID82523.1 hypothetical protein Ade03nite_14470 [Actinoplanes derwentensis]SDT35021.1 hypothetical protein SAMN04489716_3403 [Actinoplanes derwentensis]
MSDLRDYPPQPWIHQADCTDAPPGPLALRATAIRELYPYGRPHHCFDRPTVTYNRECVAEPWSESDPEPHRYSESTIQPPDAVRPLCEVCRGTHGELAPSVAWPVRIPGAAWPR